MADSSPKLYEAMFLLSQSAVGIDPEAGVAIVKQFLDRAEADVLSLGKWDERKLAYAIDGQKRGTFYLSLFNAKPDAIAQIERDCNLSEDVLRVMFIRADHMGQPEIDAAVALGGAAPQPAETPAPAIAE